MRSRRGDPPSTNRVDLAHLRRLAAFLAPHRAALAAALGATFLASGVQIAFPLLARDLFNTAFDAGAATASAPGPGRIAAILLALFALQAAFNFARVYLLGRIGERVVATLRTRVFDHLMGLAPAFFLRRKTGEITSRLTSDVATVQSLVSTALAQAVNQGVTLVGGAAALLVVNARLTLVMLAVLPPVILAGAAFARRLRRLSRDFQDRVADANADAEEAIANVRVVQASVAEDTERARYARGVDAAWRLALRRVTVRAVFVPTVILAMSAAVTLVFWVGGREVLAGTLAPGDLVAFLLLTLFVAGAVASFTGLFAQLQEGLGASRRIFDLLDEPSDLPAPTAPVPLPAGVPEVRFEDVWFRYGPALAGPDGAAPAEDGATDDGAADDATRDPWVLRGVTLTLAPGEVVALVGPSGAGKSTLAALLPRFFDPQHGHVRLGGVDVRDAAPAEVRAAVGLVPQETQLFSGSVRENVRYGRPDAGDDAVREALVAARADGFVDALPQGLDTVVGERGLRLSGGQRQRIAIARALLENPAVLVLDEATSSLDAESEAAVQAALDVLMRGRTSLVIAHRLSTVRGADRIAVVDDGRIVQLGSHDALVDQPGLYRTLFETQFRHGGAPDAAAGAADDAAASVTRAGSPRG